jgi:uncharacterized protein (TIGR03437 family)
MSILYDVPAGQSLLIQGPASATIKGAAANPAIGAGANVAGPTLTSLSPNTAVHGTGAMLTMTATGTNFSPACKITIGGFERPTTYISATQVSCVIDPSQWAAGAQPVVVKNGHLLSAAVNFTFT